jgi:glutathione S-transferase
MKVYGAILSPFVRKVLAACKLKGLDYEHEMVLPGTKTPEYLVMSPLGKIPALEDGDLRVSDSSVICEYLEEKYPDQSLLPATPELRARARWYEEYADSKLAGAVAVFFFERLIKPMMGMGETDEARLAEVAATEHPEVFAYLESQVPDQGFLFGDSLSIADVALTNPFINAGYGGFTIDADSWPRTAAWLERVKSEPVMVELLAAEQALMEQMAA